MLIVYEASGPRLWLPHSTVRSGAKYVTSNLSSYVNGKLFIVIVTLKCTHVDASYRTRNIVKLHQFCCSSRYLSDFWFVEEVPAKILCQDSAGLRRTNRSRVKKKQEPVESSLLQSLLSPRPAAMGGVATPSALPFFHI